MTTCEMQNECRDEFAEIHLKLDRMDEAIRGNGKPGIQLRLDRLEQAENKRGRVLWLIAGSISTLAVTSLWRHIFGG